MEIIIIFVLVLLFFLVMLDLGNRLAITGSTKISDVTGLGNAAVGFLLLSFSTSLPELSVGFVAPITGQAAVSVGTILGSNIINVCLILGIAVLLVSLRRPRAMNTVPAFAKEELGSLYFGLFVASVIPLSLVFVLGASWLIGLILVSIFVIFSYQMSKIRVPRGEKRDIFESKSKLPQYLFLTFAGIFVVIMSSNWIVQSAVVIAGFTGVPRTIIGATIIAFGTSLPEFSLTVRAFLKGQTALGFGNIVGSGFINITLILGVTFFVPTLVGSPLTMNMLVFQDLAVFALISNLFLWYFLSIGRLSWKEGALLLVIYLLFLANTLGAIHLRQQAA